MRDANQIAEQAREELLAAIFETMGSREEYSFEVPVTIYPTHPDTPVCQIHRIRRTRAQDLECYISSEDGDVRYADECWSFCDMSMDELYDVCVSLGGELQKH